MTTQLCQDISVLENAIIAFQEGASDEKYAALWSLEKLLLAKKDELVEYETTLEEMIVEQQDGWACNQLVA